MKKLYSVKKINLTFHRKPKCAILYPQNHIPIPLIVYSDRSVQNNHFPAPFSF